jgi:hypothetical protein
MHVQDQLTVGPLREHHQVSSFGWSRSETNIWGGAGGPGQLGQDGPIQSSTQLDVEADRRSSHSQFVEGAFPARDE